MRTDSSRRFSRWAFGWPAIATLLLVLTGMTGCGDSGSQPPAGAADGSADGVAVEMGSAAERQAAAQRWIEKEFSPSTLTPAEQAAELAWFAQAAAPYRGMRIAVVSEALTTHEYESTVLARAFAEITGINVSPTT